MEEENPIQPPAKKSRRPSSDALFNILTILICLAILIVLIYLELIGLFKAVKVVIKRDLLILIGLEVLETTAP